MDKFDVLEDIENIAILDYLERYKRIVLPHQGDDLDEVDFTSWYRLNKHTSEAWSWMLTDRLSSGTTKLLFKNYANGAHQLLSGDVGKVSQPSVSRSIKEVAEV